MTEPAHTSGRAIPIRAIIFDIGRVIVPIDVAGAFTVLGTPTGLSTSQVWSALESDPRWRVWQEGRIDPREWCKYITERFQAPLDFEKFCAVWNQALNPATILKDDLFAALVKRFKLALLSNTDPIHVAHMESDFPFVKHFPVRVYSCAIGAVKPSPKIFLTALKELGVRPQEATYIDDIAEFVEAARALGMTGIHFTGASALETELRGMGVLAG